MPASLHILYPLQCTSLHLKHFYDTGDIPCLPVAGRQSSKMTTARVVPARPAKQGKKRKKDAATTKNLNKERGKTTENI